MMKIDKDISLTGVNSHRLTIPLGQGSLAIGTIGVSEGEYDIWVEKDSVINWDAFNEFFIDSSNPDREKHPYGNWPRWIEYSGDDQGFIEWSRKRKIEDFYWFPQREATVDFREVNIQRLFVYSYGEGKIQISIDNKIPYCQMIGYIDNFEFNECSRQNVSFALRHHEGEEIPYQLPAYKALQQVQSISIEILPVGEPFDCASLLYYQNLRAISLQGNVTNLGVLAKFPNLTEIQLRYIPNLQDMPALSNWKELEYFVGYNIEETVGKELRAQLRKLSKERQMRYVSISQLRKRAWFATEYGIPFSNWGEKNAKKATRAYKSCLAQIKKAKTEDNVQEAIVGFVEKINQLDGIETTEREDVAVAIKQLTDISILEIPQENWQLWFDEVRNF